MSQAISHRGPDGSGAFVDDRGGVAFAHRRLAIIDPSPASAQPMVDDRGAQITYNGELYNFRELRAEMERAGERFTTTGDIEVVLRSLRLWGRDALQRFAGMFALAYRAPGSDRILLARDPTGIKPLFVATVPGGQVTLFASDVRALLASGLVSRETSDVALSQYLEFGYAFDGVHSLVRGVTKVAPGEWLELEHGREVHRQRYFVLPPPRDSQGDLQSRDEALAQCLGAVVREHLIADVPIGVLLSGGLDSSVVAAVAARHGPVRTMSFGFEGAAVDERPFAAQVARSIGADHTEFTIRPDDVVALLRDDAGAVDDLIADGGVLSTRLGYREARRQGLKVVLVGEGSDEVFGGYPVFGAAARARGPDAWRSWKLFRSYAGRRYGRGYLRFARRLRRMGGDGAETVRRFELEHQVPNQYVVKVDRASMAEGIEARTPFLDRRVVVAGLGFSTEELGVREEGKRPLRRFAAQLGLPKSIVERSKFGMALAPEWLDSSTALRTLARDVLLPSGSVVDRLGFRREVTKHLVEGAEGMPWPSPFGVLRHLTWRLLVLGLWSRAVGVAV